MRTRTLLFPSLLIAFGWLAACDDGQPVAVDELLVSEASVARLLQSAPSPVCAPSETPLIAGQSIDVGSVIISNDETHLYVSYYTTGGWEMAETHLSVTDSRDGIPQAPGRFGDTDEHDPPEDEVHYAIPLSRLSGTTAIVAAHADVRKGDREEGAWASGEQITDGGNWAMYVEYDVVTCAVASIPAAGGSLTSSDDNVTVTFQEGSLSDETAIFIYPVSVDDLPPGALPGTAYDFEPDGLVFNQPVEIRVGYDDAGLTAAQEAALGLHYLNETTNVFERVPGTTVDASANEIVGLVDHFSVYAVVQSLAEITLDATPQPVLEEATLTHDLTLTSLSGSDLTGVEVRLLAKGLVNTPNAPANCTAAGITSGPDSPALLFVCDVDLAAGTSESLSISVRAQPGSGGTQIESSASFVHGSQSASTPSLFTDITPLDDADLALSMTATPDPVPAGDALTHVIDVTNNGPDDAGDVTVRVEITEDVSVTTLPGNCVWLDPPGVKVVDCEIGAIAVGSSASVSFAVTPLTGGQTLTSTGSILEIIGASDPDLSNNSASETTVVESLASADLAVGLVAQPDPVTEGSDLTHSISVTNSGPDATGEVVVRLEVTEDVVVSSMPSNCGWFDPGPVKVIDCTFSSGLASGATTAYDVVVTPQTGGQTLTSTASIFKLLDAQDPDLSNNSESDQTVVENAATAAADLSVSITDTPDPVEAGSVLDYSIVLANAGPDGVTDVTVGFKVYEPSLSEPAVLSSGCSLFGKASDHYLYLCEMASLAAATNHTFTISLKPQTVQSLKSEASIDSYTGPSDPDLTNNQDTEFTEVQSATGLSGYALLSSDRATAGVYDLYEKNLSTGTVTRLTTDANANQPEWSPDRTKVAFHSRSAPSSDTYEIRVLDLNASTVTTVASGFRAHKASWSPDGTEIAYTAYDGSDWEIFVVNVSTQAVRAITTAAENDTEPAWSPDGTKIAFQRDYGSGTFAVLTADAAGGGNEQTIYNGVLDDLRYSPDGTKIAGAQWKTQDPIYEIVTIDVASGTATTLTGEGTRSFNPVWSPDGTQLLFSRHDDVTGHYEIYLVGATGGAAMLVESSSENTHAGGWRN